jgi:HlyD family type I secretion membrane fusion protein
MSMSHDSLMVPGYEGLSETLAASNMRGTVIAGVTVIAIAFGGFGTWASLAPLDSAVVAHGQLTVETKRKTIQHLEGGIVKEILVKEGDSVVPGQVLMRLDDTKAESSMQSYQDQYNAALAQLTRLQSERDNLAEVTFPPSLLQRTDPQSQALLSAQRAQFEERRKSQEGQSSVLEQRIAQYNAEIQGYKVQGASRQRQISLSYRELTGLRELAAKGYYPKNRLLAMERDIARLEGEMGSDASTEARARKGISETEMQILQTRQQFREQVAKELDTAQNTTNGLREQLIAAQDMVRRLEVVAPVAGAVQNIHVATNGGVVASGAELMDIVPSDDRLVIDAQVSPADIESVQNNQTAEVRFSALHGRNTPVLQGRVQTVSADHLTDNKTGAPYYAARIEVPPEQLARLENRHIQAGMPVEVLIKGGERTALDYMLRPLADSFATAFKER